MPSSVTMWFSRLSPEMHRRLERAEALAREELVETHARLGVDLVGILAPRMPFDEAIERYIESMGLEGDDAEMVGTRAVALMDEEDVQEDLAREGHRGWKFDWRYATPLGALRFIRRQVKRSNQEELWLELAAARAEEAVSRVHERHAMAFVELLDEEVDPVRALELYADRLELTEFRGRLVYQRVMAALAEQMLPRLNEDEAAALPGARAAALPPALEGPPPA
jgi:hypothetical protein